MNNLYDPSDCSAILARIEKISPSAERQWGKMNVAQMLAHCNAGMETAMGIIIYKQIFIGKLLSRFIIKAVLSEKPFSKNSPTDKTYLFPANVGFEDSKKRLIASVRKFHASGPSKCTVHPHPFFGKLTPDEWAILQWKHLDHHLRQFSA